jgi:hypothetical protein
VHKGKSPDKVAALASAEGWKLSVYTIRAIEKGQSATVSEAMWQAYNFLLDWPPDAHETLMAGGIPRGNRESADAARVEELERAVAALTQELPDLIRTEVGRAFSVIDEQVRQLAEQLGRRALAVDDDDRQD